MNTFVKKALLISLSFSVGIVAFVFAVHAIVKHNSNFDISEDRPYIIVGHSHPESAFDDDLITGFKNLSMSGESYFYTYHKLKEVIPNNTIKAVFIEYSNTLIIREMDEWIWGYEKMNAYFPWHSPFMSKEDLTYLYTKNPEDFKKVVSTSTRNNLIKILSNHLTIDHRFGAYNRLTNNSVQAHIEKLRDNDTSADDPADISVDNLSYLEKIIAYCHSRNVKVFLIRSPQHKRFPRENEDILINIKAQRFKNLDFLDFDKFPLEDEQFADLGHLNYKGAEPFSEWFNALIEDGLLMRPDKSEFVKLKLEKLVATETVVDDVNN